MSNDQVIMSTIIKNVGIYSYAIDKTNYKLLFIDENMKGFSKGAKIGEVCYKAFYNADKPCPTCKIQEGDFESLIYDPCNGGIWFKGMGISEKLEDNENCAIMINTPTSKPEEIMVVKSEVKENKA